jgi:hypothetical protein
LFIASKNPKTNPKTQNKLDSKNFLSLDLISHARGKAKV